MDRPILSVLLFAALAAFLFSYTGRRNLAKLAFIIAFAGILADKGTDALRYLGSQQNTRASASYQEKPNPSTPALAEYSLGDVKQLPTCLPPERDKPIQLRPGHTEVGFNGSPVCWSQKICQDGSVRMRIDPDFDQAHWVWPDNWNPIFIAKDTHPNLTSLQPVCVRLLGAGHYEIRIIVPPSTSYSN